MAQPLEPDDIDGDIYDEVANLEKWQAVLSDLISSNDITQEEFDYEMLKTRYYIDLKTKTYVLDDDDAKIIENLRKYKYSLTENYKFGVINEDEFNREYNSILRKEYDILKMSESDEKESKTIRTEIDLPLSEKLEKLHDSEVKYDKSIAKKYDIVYPSLPSGFSKDQINQYYNLKITNEISKIVPEIEEYLQKYASTKQLIDYYTSSYEITKVFYNADTKKSNYEFKKIAPLSNKLRDITVIEKRANLLNPEEQAYSDRLNILKNRLRQMPRTDLLKCAGVRTLRYMSYIERLRENKQNVIKFKSHPENYNLLKDIIQEDNEYYKIPSDQLFKQYVYFRPEIFGSSIDEKETDIAQYVEKGTTGYLAIKEGADLKNLGENLDNFVTILPIQDELYTKITTQSGNKTELATAWELRLSLPGSNKKNIIKRYLSFEDYLKDLKDILVANSKMIRGVSRDILNSKIRKINYYLKYSEDPETYLPNGHASVSELFKNKQSIYSMRQKGLYKLLDLFTSYYPGCDTLVEKIETDIFEYSTKNYDFNINKIKFLINNYQDKLNDLITGDLSIMNLLTYETPRTLPEEDIDIKGDKQENIDKLLKWRPDTSFYDNYRTELENINYRFYKFKKDHPELTNLQISQIMSQYSEDLQWKRTLESYKELIVPEGYIELNYRLRFLLKNRNRLPSRRIFTLATVSDRIETQRQFLVTFTKCRVPEPNDYSILTETIVYGLSKTPEEYAYYTVLVNSEYKKLCEYFTKVNLKCKLDSDGTVKCILSFEPNVLTSIITEFLITQGEFSTVDIERLKNFTDNIDSSKIISYIQNLRGEEIDSYNRSITEQLNQNSTPLKEIYLKATRIIKSAKMRKQLDDLALIANNTYKPPVVVIEKPVKVRNIRKDAEESARRLIDSGDVKTLEEAYKLQGSKYTPKYIKIGDYYVYGGVFPMFNTYGKNGEVLKENYTRYDLEQLASIYNLEILEDSFELYKSIMQFIYNYDEKEIVVNEINFNPIEYNTYFEYLKTPVKSINYAIRPRIGVKDPGEVYTVIKDQVKVYGVPFDFNEYTIPIYSEDLKERVDNGFVVIEGPCVFQKTSPENNITSDSYINIEYKDSRGKSKLFREGVSNKKVLKKTMKSLNTCSRFLTKESCDDPNSYSLDVDGLKFKCKWLKEKCKGVIVDSDELKNFDINKVSFKEYLKNKLWKTAIDKSIKYVEELTKLNDLNEQEINVLAKEQKLRLLEYYKKLNKPRNLLKTIPEEKTAVKSYSIIDEFEDILKPTENVVTSEKIILDGYTDITIYNLTTTNIKLPMKRILLNNEYVVNGITVIPKEYNETDNSYTCQIKENGEVITLYKNEFRIQSNEIVTKPVPLFCYIKNEDLPFIDSMPGYYYYLKNIVYVKDKNEIVRKEEIYKENKVPTNFITPSSLLNGKPLISRLDILEAVAKTAFSTLKTEDGFIYDIIEKVNAEKDAIEFAVKNKIDINEMFSKIIGTINIVNVIEEYEKNSPKKIISRTELTNILQEAVQNRDKSKISEYFVRAKKAKIDSEILKEAKKLLKELPEIQEVKPIIEVPIEEPKKEPEINRNIYTSSRRRR